jgi:uracil-DNA glycosylase
VDARPLPNSVFKEYMEAFRQEISTINPKVIISFGNQVSSVLLDKPITVSSWRKKPETLHID